MKARARGRPSYIHVGLGYILGRLGHAEKGLGGRFLRDGTVFGVPAPLWFTVPDICQTLLQFLAASSQTQSLHVLTENTWVHAVTCMHHVIVV